MEKTFIDVDSKIRDADNCAQQGNFALAASIYQGLIEQQPNSAFLYSKLGQVKAQAKEWELATENYQIALKLGIKPAFWTYKNLGDALRELERYDEAISNYQRAINLDPKQPDVYDSLGQVQSLQGDYTAAIASYKQAIKHGIVDSFWTYKNLEDALEAVGRSKDEADVLKEISQSANETKQEPVESKEIIESVSDISEPADTAPDKLKSTPAEIFAELSDREFIQKSFNELLGRSVGESEIALFLKHFEDKTLNRATVLENIMKSHEFAQKSAASKVGIFAEQSDAEFMQYLYKTLLKRPIEKEALEAYGKVLKNGTTRTAIIESIFKSEEFIATNNQSILEEFSDYEFLHIIWEILFDQICDFAAERHYYSLFDAGYSRKELIFNLIQTEQFQARVRNFGLSSQKPTAVANNAVEDNTAWIMGTGEFVNQKQWNEKLLKVLVKQTIEHAGDRPEAVFDHQVSPLVKEFLATHQYPLVSIITSLYKGGKYIKHFMENITTQTIFAGCELIIIDANSPEGESEMIKEYQEKYDNIKYIRTEEIIGIYNAWNLGVENATGEFCTNANLDDLRSHDCLEKQAHALLKHQNFDLVYQDVYYTFTPNLPFEVIAKCNIKSDLPMATRANMLQFNSPHNAPMWRRNLHERVGLFNASYKSAGDYEMWLRAMLHGSKLLKIEEPLVAYYNNPEGLSTKGNTRGVNEAVDIQRVYIKLFGNNFFSMTKKDFIDFCQTTLGILPDSKVNELVKNWRDKESFLYDYFLQAIKNSASEKKYISL